MDVSNKGPLRNYQVTVSDTLNSNNKYTIDFECNKIEVTCFLAKRIVLDPIRTEIVEPQELIEPKVYKAFTNLKEKEAYRQDLLNQLETEWKKTLAPEKAEVIKTQFIKLAHNLDRDGALIMAAITSSESFTKLIDAYNKIIDDSGSKSWIHAFINLANHPDFLTNKEFNHAFMHPLILAVLSYRLGGALRIVDARGKDAEPIQVLAQDNMLHVDNTPFNEEFKIILTWEKGKPSGPKGQNFAFLPGAHKGARQAIKGENGVYSTEDASIFTRPDDIDRIFSIQEKMYGKRAVVELSHPTKPLTTLFFACLLPHHRFRTEEGFARSCVIIAIHRAKDNPGQLVAPEHLIQTAAATDSLYQALLGNSKLVSDEAFIKALLEKSQDMVDLLTHLDEITEAAELIIPSEREMTQDEIEKWKKACTEAPTVKQKKIEADVVPLGQSFNLDEFIDRVGKMMAFDKHGPLDLILYSDSHEEPRKWARNQIRERKIDRLNSELKEVWKDSFHPPDPSDLLEPNQLQQIANQLATIAMTKMQDEKSIAAHTQLPPGEKIAPFDAYRSVHQLLIDLGETIVRCKDEMAFLSTSLFLFWAAHTLMQFEPEINPTIKQLGEKLLNNYIATNILIEKQIQFENIATTLD